MGELSISSNTEGLRRSEYEVLASHFQEPVSGHQAFGDGVEH